MSPNVFDESIQTKGPYSKKEVQALEQKLAKMPLEEIRKQLDGLSAQVENKLKSANTGSLDSKYKKFLTVAENLGLVGKLYDQLSPEQKGHVDTYTRESSERSVAVAQSAFMKLGFLSPDTVLGVFDKETLYAVISFQKTSKDYKGQQDGLIGKQTLTALQAALQSGEKINISPVLAETIVELQQVKNDIQDVKQKVNDAQQKINDTQEQKASVPLVQQESVVFTQASNDVDVVSSTPTVENAQEFVDAVTNVVANPTKIETIPIKTIPVQETVKDIEIPTNKDKGEASVLPVEKNKEGVKAPVVEQNKDIQPTPVTVHKQEEVILVAEKKAEEETPMVEKTKEVVTTPVVEQTKETIKDGSSIESNESISLEPWSPIYNTLDDYIMSYMDGHGQDIAKISKEELPNEIRKHTKEALLANPDILRYGMVLRAQDSKGVSYIGTLIEDPSKKDFSKSAILHVNSLSAQGKIHIVAFPLENIVEVLPHEKKVLNPDQQKKFDQLEAKYHKEQLKKAKKGESKKETSEK